MCPPRTLTAELAKTWHDCLPREVPGSQQEGTGKMRLDIQCQRRIFRGRPRSFLLVAVILLLLGLFREPATASPPGGGRVAMKAEPSLYDDELEVEEAPSSLRGVEVPKIEDLDRYIADKGSAELLGKALFWDLQLGSDGWTACASCHWHAGADVRIRNTVTAVDFQALESRIGEMSNYLLKAEDFPFRKLADATDRDSRVLRDLGMIAGSQGVVKRDFLGVTSRRFLDNGELVLDDKFDLGGLNARQVTGRNSPTVINAVFLERQFWDGRAQRVFNGVNIHGDRDPSARVWYAEALSAEPVKIAIENASLASQAVGPPHDGIEMSWSGRSFQDIGRKMLAMTPLALQRVDPTDSLLGDLANPKGRGLKSQVTYSQLIRKAFRREWWQAKDPVEGGYTQMEANFSMFMGLAILMYESTLISDQSPYDRYAEGEESALSDRAKQGLEIFVNQGKCINCHTGPQFAGGVTSVTRPVDNSIQSQMIETITMSDRQTAFYDGGFYNIGVRSNEEDLGVGGSNELGPLSYTLRRQLGEEVAGAIGVPPEARTAVQAAFKTPSLRNVELTGPYFHNGSQATLEQVVEFYARGGDFHHDNRDLSPDIEPIPELANDPKLIGDLVEFLKSLTDPRVAEQKPPFDHPELIVPHGHRSQSKGVAGDQNLVFPATGASGGARLKTFEQILADGVPN
jgi:cytochrome c peroxidase